MRFSYLDAMVAPVFLKPLAVAAEEAGYDGFTVPDSICYPEHSESTYPYTADGAREFLEDRPFIEPFALIPYLASATERIRFITFVVKLPLRNPVLAAKQASSVAVLADNRFSFGVGLSPWPDDFAAVDLPWERRGKRMDEMIEIIRGLTQGGYYQFSGEFFQVPSIKICPVPTETIPILIGGHSEVALRRAVRLGQGWMHAGGDKDDLGELLDRLADIRRASGRENEPFEVHVISPDAYSADGVRRLEDRGVTDVVVGFRNSYLSGPDPQSLDDKIGAMRAFADSVIAKVR